MSSEEAKAATRQEIQGVIAYFQSAIVSHNANILKYQRLAKIPFFSNNVNLLIKHEEANIALIQQAIGHENDLLAYYRSIGRA